MDIFGRKAWIFLAGAGGAALLFSSASGPEGGSASAQTSVRFCTSALSATGHGKLQGVAADLAKANWNNHRPSGTYLFHKSDNQDVTCHHDGRPAMLRQWTCIATAEPCSGDDTVTNTGGTGTSPPLCQSRFSATGDDAKLQTWAENRAVAAWQSVALSAYGGNYQAWGNAQGRDTTCHNNGLGPLQRRWTCVATATPCRTP
ncbi:MAG: hypothetical protein QOK17_2739 [Sphingomonadales bacterium]|nr:hypothetical protein [Sphingomonadales bacterium]